MTPRLPPEDDAEQPPGADLDVWERRQRRRAEEEARRRRTRRRRLGVTAGAVAALIVGGAGIAAIVDGRRSEEGSGTTSTAAETLAPVGTLPSEEPRRTVTTAGRVAGREPRTSPSRDTTPSATTPPRARAAAGGAGGPAADVRGPVGERRPVVWVQAGHVPPGEPGYRAQTGAGGGPFGSEQAFNTRTQTTLIRFLRRRGVDARATGALVTPWGARGAAFVSIHFDSPGGAAALGHAVSMPGRHENWYRGEGTGTASPVPHPDSAPHRDHTEVTPAVERRSRALADAIASRYRRAFVPANGAGSRFRGVEPRSGNVRMMHFYGYYRTSADARVLIETGAAGADDRFLARTDLIATTIGLGILDHLKAGDRVR